MTSLVGAMRLGGVFFGSDLASFVDNPELLIQCHDIASRFPSSGK